jgi:GT2 family glycosyltransferase
VGDPESTLVVVTWNCRDDLRRLLESVGSTLGDRTEIVVVDNASQDGSADEAEGSSLVDTVIRERENAGFGAASNAGVRAARSDVVVLLNPDTVLVDDSLLALARLARDRRALCGPRLVGGDGVSQPSASPPPGGWEVAVDALLPAAFMPPPLRERCEPSRAERCRKVGWLTGACVAAPRDILLRLGPFDEELHMYGEDLDLGLRARAAGIPVLFAPDVARIVHLGERSTTQRFGATKTALKISTRREVVRRRRGSRRELLDFGSQLVFYATRYAAKSALGRDGRWEREWLSAALSG